MDDLPKESDRFCLEQDDTCHWYIIPWSKRGEWQDFLGNVDSHGSQFDDVPPWAERINTGPSSVSFSYPMVELEG